MVLVKSVFSKHKSSLFRILSNIHGGFTKYCHTIWYGDYEARDRTFSYSYGDRPDRPVFAGSKTIS